MKKTIILTIALSLAVGVFADRRNIKDRADNWLQRENTETSGGSLRGEGDAPGIGDKPIPNNPTSPDPIGSGLTVMLVLGAGYSLMRKRK
jgi:hypothetical protein